MVGELIDRAETFARYADIIVKVRDIFLRIGPEQGDRLATCSDPVECAKIVTGEVLRGLGVMSAVGKATTG